jgi:hypothetical protein
MGMAFGAATSSRAHSEPNRADEKRLVSHQIKVTTFLMGN